LTKLTAPLLDKLWKEGEPASYTDDICTGLKLNITGPKRANWTYRYQINDRRREMGIGSFPDCGLAEARDEASRAREFVRQGIDPLEARKSERAKAKAQTARDLTVRQLWERFRQDKGANWTERVAKNYCRLMEMHVFPPSSLGGDELVRHVGRDDIRKTLLLVWDNRGVVRTVRDLLSRMFDYAEFYNLGDRGGKANPVRKITRYMPPLKSGTHHKAMPYQQIPEFMAKLRGFALTHQPKWYRTDIDRAAIITDRAAGMSIPKLARKFGVSQGGVRKVLSRGEARIVDPAIIMARALEALILTGPPRRGELLQTKWSEIDYDQELLRIPRDRMKVKTGDEYHIAPLSKRVLEIFREMEALRSGDYVFPGSTRGRDLSDQRRFAIKHPGVVGFHLTGEALLNFMRREMGCAADVSSIHGLRKTFKNWARNRGFDPELIEGSLDHVYGSKIERTYQDDRLVERR
jgi:integrase